MSDAPHREISCPRRPRTGGAADVLQRLPFARGTEDFDYDRRGGRLIVSALERRSWVRRGQGALWAVPLGEREAGPPEELRWELPEVFRPAGLLLFDDGRTRRVFVVNRSKPPTVEVFDLAAGALRRLAPIRSPELRRPNGIVAVGPEEVYVSNDGTARSGIVDNVGKLFRRGSGNVLLCRPEGCQVVAEGIAFANGLALSADGKHLYVAAFLERAIRVYERRADGTLGSYERISLPSLPDNLKWEDRAAGRLNAACHVSFWRTSLHLLGLVRRAPSEGFRLDLEGSPPRCERLYADSGQLLPAASTALVVGGRVYVSFLVGEGVAVLAVPAP